MIRITLKVLLVFSLFSLDALGQDKIFKQFSTYPCPTTGQTKIFLRDYYSNSYVGSKAILNVYDIRGLLVKVITVNVYGVGTQISDTINLSDLPSGRYILKIDLGLIYLSQVIVQK